jgi:TnpA family transposase
LKSQYVLSGAIFPGTDVFLAEQKIKIYLLINEMQSRLAYFYTNVLVTRSWVLARLNRHSRRNRLYLAFQELGRVVRTVYLLNWIADDALRAGVTDGANKVETFHEFSDFLNFGSRGVLRTNNPDEQEKMAVYNQLVANAVMIQNVVDQTRVLHELHQEGYPISKDDLAFMSPYVTRNLNRFGDYPTWYKTEPAPANKGLPI